jgi:GAF domain-containing protein
MPVDAERLAKTLAHLRSSDFQSMGVAVALQRVVDDAQTVFEVTGTGLMFMDDEQVMRYVAASDDPGRVLEVAQEEHGVGPCVDALINDVVVRADDIERDARYAAIAPIIVPVGVRAVLGLPVHIGGAAIGSLNAYCDHPTEWDDASVDALGAFASVIETIVASALLSERQSHVVAQLEYALQNRVTIERAVGVIMMRENLDAVSAFNRLRDEARHGRRKVADVAQKLLDPFGEKLSQALRPPPPPPRPAPPPL